MRFTATALEGAWIVDIDAHVDGRGFFARTYCDDEFAERGLNRVWPQISVSHNLKRGTLRGMHYQIDPHAECKLIRCTRGTAYDVIVDLRVGSPTFRQWIAVELTAENGRAIYVPAGFAHGFQTLVDDTDMVYQISARYAPDAARGVRWNDPMLSVDWPIDEPILSDRDRGYPDLK